MAISSRFTFSNTANPKMPMQKSNIPLLPHWPGEIHALPVIRIVVMIPKLVGLKKCLRDAVITPSDFCVMRKINLEEILSAPANSITTTSFVLSNRQRLSAEMMALFNEWRSLILHTMKMYCIAKQEQKAAANTSVAISQ